MFFSPTEEFQISPSYPTAKRYIKPLPRGSTQPHVIRFSDNESYIVKFQGNPRGRRVLVNEYICSELIHILHFSGLRGQLLEVNSFFIGNEVELKGRNLNAGLQYGSPYIEHHDDFNTGYVQHLVNREDLAQVITFDTFICNKDRRSGNLLINLGDPTEKNRNSAVFN